MSELTLIGAGSFCRSNVWADLRVRPLLQPSRHPDLPNCDFCVEIDSSIQKILIILILTNRADTIRMSIDN